MKYWKKITIAVLMVAIFLAPISGGVKVDGNKKITIFTENTQVRAQQTQTQIIIQKNQINDTSASLQINIQNTTSGYLDGGAIYTLYDQKWDITKGKKPDNVNVLQTGIIPVKENLNLQTLPLLLTKLTKTTPYFLTVFLMQTSASFSLTPPYYSQVPSNSINNAIEFITGSDSVSNNGQITSNTSQAINISGDFFNCGVNPIDTSNWVCAFAALIYYAVFAPMSAFTSLSAKILDFFVYYSTNSTSYSASFVSNAWAAVRDVANIFFIIALLYIGIQTILGLGSHSKKLISAIIVIALVINFSLFTTKLVIDGSNILAKVFYNNITSVDETGKTIPAGEGGQKSITIGLVKQFDPQSIFGNNFKGHEGLFIFVTILSIILMGFMIYIFISIAILFVSRVVSLWLAMIFSPIAFISYTVPFDIPGFGHKEFWKNLIGTAFLAPLFIFFLYIIALFGDALKNIPYDVSGTASDVGSYLDAAMKTIIPFVIIFILLMQAKKLAVKYSGEMGKVIQGLAGTIGGLALGGAALGTAAIGRGTVGAFMKGASTGESSNQRFARGESINRWDKIKGGAIHYATLGGLTKAQKSVGEKLKEDEHKVDHAAHARHELDSEASKVAPGKKWEELNGDQRKKVELNMEREKVKRNNGLGNKTWAQLSDEDRDTIDLYAKENIDNKKSVTGKMITASREKQGVISSLAQSSVTGSYDIRNLSNLTMNAGDNSLNKLATFITSGVAKGIRSGLKETLQVNYGESQNGFLKDLGHTLSEALKSSKVNINLSNLAKVEKEHHAGGHSEHDEHGGGDHGSDHGGGHH